VQKEKKKEFKVKKYGTGKGDKDAED